MENLISAGSSYINTYVLGSVVSASECTSILLYNRNNFEDNPEYSKISLYNLSNIYNLVSNSSKRVKLVRETKEDSFRYSIDTSPITGFNVIIYIGNASNTAIGYTEFINTQGYTRDVDIQLQFNSKLEKGLEVHISNSLSQLKNSSTLQKNFTSEELCGFASSKKILDNLSLSDYNFRYTNHLSRLFLEKDQKCVVGANQSIVQSPIVVSKLGISCDISFDPFSVGFNKFQVSIYNSDLVLYVWKKDDEDWLINVISLTKVNRFGLPVTIIKNAGGINRIQTKYKEGSKKELLYFAGRYAVFSIDGKTEMIDIERNGRKDAWYSKSYYGITVDPCDPSGIIRDYPRTLTYRTAVEYIPELNNVFLDLQTYSAGNAIYVVKKFGEWFILERRLNSTSSEYIFTNMRCTIHVSSEEYLNNKIHFINNQLIMIEYEDYFIIYGKQTGEYCTEKSKEVLYGQVEGSRWVTFNNNPFYLVDGSGYEDFNTRYKNYYSEKIIDVIKKSDNIYETSLNRFRRRYYPQELSAIPEIVCTFGGLIFYRKNNILNYL